MPTPFDKLFNSEIHTAAPKSGPVLGPNPNGGGGGPVLGPNLPTLPPDGPFQPGPLDGGPGPRPFNPNIKNPFSSEPTFKGFRNEPIINALDGAAFKALQARREQAALENARLQITREDALRRLFERAGSPGGGPGGRPARPTGPGPRPFGPVAGPGPRPIGPVFGPGPRPFGPVIGPDPRPLGPIFGPGPRPFGPDVKSAFGVNPILDLLLQGGR